MKPFISNILWLFSFITCLSVNAQQSVRLEEAIQIALKNNGKLLTESTSVQYRQTLIQSAYRFNPTQITGEFGQFNSAYFDTGFGISQSFELPGVYKRRAAAYQQNAKSSKAKLKMSEAEIKQDLDELFSGYSYLQAKEQLLYMQDSLYQGFLERASLRWQKGETDQLEKTTAEQQKISIAGQLAEVTAMKQYLRLTLDWILNDGNSYTPAVTAFDIVPYDILADSTALVNHPALVVADLDIQTAKAYTRLEEAAFLPQFSLGYRNIGIRGTGADNLVYDASDRFSSFQVGVGIPVFRKGYRSAVKGAKMQEEVKMKEYEAVMHEFQTRLGQQYLLYNETMIRIQQFRKQSLPNARIIRSVSEKKFTAGEINYLEFVMLINQAVQIESDYLELINKVNTYIINLYYLTHPN